MDIDKIKNDYKKMRSPKMDISISDTSTLAESFTQSNNSSRCGINYYDNVNPDKSN